MLLADGPEPIISYRTGWVVYEESLTKGQFVGRGWNGAGYVNFYDGRLDPAEYPMPQAFHLEIDGQLLATDWKWGGLQKTPSTDGNSQAVITLEHTVRPVTVKVHTKLDGTAVLTRWLEITNTGKQPAALAMASPWSGVLRKTDRWRSHLEGTSLPLYSVGYFDNTRWGQEGDFHWHDMPEAGYHVDGRYRRGRYRHPMFMLRNNAMGELFIGQLAWTGGYSFDFELDPKMGEGQPLGDAAAMTFQRRPGWSISFAHDCARRDGEHTRDAFRTCVRRSRRMPFRPCTHTCGKACSCRKRAAGRRGWNPESAPNSKSLLSR